MLVEDTSVAVVAGGVESAEVTTHLGVVAEVVWTCPQVADDADILHVRIGDVQSIHKDSAQGSGDTAAGGRNCRSGKQIIATGAPARGVTPMDLGVVQEVSECAIAQGLAGFVAGLQCGDIHWSTEDGVYDGHVLVPSTI